MGGGWGAGRNASHGARAPISPGRMALGHVRVTWRAGRTGWAERSGRAERPAAGRGPCREGAATRKQQIQDSYLPKAKGVFGLTSPCCLAPSPSIPPSIHVNHSGGRASCSASCLVGVFQFRLALRSCLGQRGIYARLGWGVSPVESGLALAE
jgi:hypothetical protein